MSTDALVFAIRAMVSSTSSSARLRPIIALDQTRPQPGENLLPKRTNSSPSRCAATRAALFQGFVIEIGCTGTHPLHSQLNTAPAVIMKSPVFPDEKIFTWRSNVNPSSPEVGEKNSYPSKSVPVPLTEPPPSLPADRELPPLHNPPASA